MKRSVVTATLGVVAGMVLTVSSARGGTVTKTLYPSVVPDEQDPRGANIAPTGWGSTSWQGPATGKSNLQIRDGQDGDLLGQLFPNYSSLTINDLASISYWTNRDSEAAGRDWWVTIYTATTGSGDAGSWYHQKFTGNYTDHTNTTWAEYSTVDGSLKFDGMTLASLQAQAGGQVIETIAIQTDSGWNGFNGYVDGITITAMNGDVGRADLAAVPLPNAAWGGLAMMGVLGGVVARKRLRNADA